MLGKSRQQQRKKASVRFLSFPIPLPLKKSRCLASASYVPRTGELTVTFQAGLSLSHPGISIGTVIGLIRADSAGRYYNAHIRGREGRGGSAGF